MQPTHADLANGHLVCCRLALAYIVYSKILPIEKHCWKMASEFSDFTSESCFALFVQDVCRRHPLPDGAFRV